MAHGLSKGDVHRPELSSQQPRAAVVGGIEAELFEVVDSAHATATAVAALRAMGIGSRGVQSEPETIGHLLTDAPCVSVWATPLEALWDDALDDRKAGRFGEYAWTLARIAVRLVESGQSQRAVSCLAVAGRIARELGVRSLSVHVLSARAHLLFWSGDFAMAARLHEIVLGEVRTWCDPVRLAEVLLALGDSCFFAGAAVRAESCWCEALLVYEHTGDLAAQAETLERIAGLLLGRGDVESGLEHAELAERLWVESGVARGRRQTVLAGTTLVEC